MGADVQIVPCQTRVIRGNKENRGGLRAAQVQPSAEYALNR